MKKIKEIIRKIKEIIMRKEINKGREKAKTFEQLLIKVKGPKMLERFDYYCDDHNLKEGERILNELKEIMEKDIKTLQSSIARQAYKEYLLEYFATLRRDTIFEDHIVYMTADRLGGYCSRIVI